MASLQQNIIYQGNSVISVETLPEYSPPVVINKPSRRYPSRRILKLFLLTLLVGLITLVTSSASAQVTYAQGGHNPAASSELAPSPPKAQSIKFDHLSLESGLSNNQITSIIRDQQGFMWFGSFHGRTIAVISVQSVK